MFEREDWTLFRNLGTLCQKAGVPARLLRRLVVKELVDNALDATAGDPEASAQVELGRDGSDSYWVQDFGAGIPGNAQAVARLFSVGRPLSSTKVLRLPVRGALGNGLRVVVGAVLATGGTLEVTTRDRHYRLKPLDDGTTQVLEESVPDSDCPGTRVQVNLGAGLPSDKGDLSWGTLAKTFRHSRVYQGKTSAWWYDLDSFYELLQAAGDRPLAELLAQFDGYGLARGERDPVTLNMTGEDAAELADVILAGVVRDGLCRSVGRATAGRLLDALRAGREEVPPGKIGLVGPEGWPGAGYAREGGVLSVAPGRGGTPARLPYMVECWAVAKESQDDSDEVVAYVNGTPITGEMRIRRDKSNLLAVFGCGLSHHVERVGKSKCTVLLNVTTPYMPITTDGKEPDFSRYLEPLGKVISRATKKLKSNIRKAENRSSQQEVILASLDDAISQASGGGQYRYSLRQLYYAVRPAVLASSGGAELSYDYFSRVITQCEASEGELSGMYRDPRGTLYHPHLGRSIPLGTLAVEDYERPRWTFNKILYLEKEGFSHLLQSVGWPERHDCAILSSKGFASRAVRDVLDLLGDTDEEIQFFCVHDADASGTLIYQALQEGTTARRARRVKIVNLGLDPWEAIEASLAVEDFTRKSSRRLPVARYVSDRDRDDDSLELRRFLRRAGASNWEEWLQSHRVELNAMSSPAFLSWIDRKMAPYDGGKVVPPAAVLREQLRGETETALRRAALDRLAREHDLDAQVRQAMLLHEDALAGDLTTLVQQHLLGTPEQRWTEPLRRHAAALAGQPPA